MKRQYEVRENEVQREDDSFKLCFGTMLIFLAVSILTCVCFWPRNMVEKKVSYSNTVHDSWSGHFGKKDKTTTTSTDEQITKYETQSSTISRQNLPTLSTLVTINKYTFTTEVSKASEATETVLDETESSHNSLTSVPVGSESDITAAVVTDETANGEETIESFITSETTTKSSSQGSSSSSTLLENVSFDDFPENTIPYSSSSTVMNDLSTPVENSHSKTYEDVSTFGSTNEVNTKQTQIMTTDEVPEVTEESPEPSIIVPTLTPNTEDDSTAEDGFDTELVTGISAEDSSSGSGSLLETSTGLASFSSTNNAITSDYDDPSLSLMDDIKSDTNASSSIDLNDLLVDFVSNTSTTEPACRRCPEPACPICLVEAYPTVKTTSAPIGKTCGTRQCHKVASRLLSLVNVSVDPCEDFYSYACGGLLDSPVLLEDDPSLDVWNRIEKAVKNISQTSPSSHQKLKDFYKSCVDYDQLVTLEERKTQGREVLLSVGQFFDASTSPDEDLTELLIRLLRFGSGILFSVGLDLDSANFSQLQVVLSLPDRLWLSSRLLITDERSSRCRLKAVNNSPLNLTDSYNVYTDCMNDVSAILDETRKALEFFKPFATNSSLRIQEILQSVELDLFQILKGLPPPSVAQKDIQSKNYKLLSKVQLESEIPQVAWGHLLSTLFNVEFDDIASVQVYFMDYIKDLFAQLQTKSFRSIHNSLLAVFAYDLYSNVAQTYDPFNREHYCLQVTASLLPAVTSNLYLTTFPPDVDQALRQQVLLIYQQLVSSMESRISAATWLNERSLNELMKKLRFMSVQLPEMFTDSQLTNSLGKCELGNQQYFEDVVCLLQQLQSHMFALYSTDPHTTHALWPHFLTSFSTKPLLIHGLNTFLVPHAAVALSYDTEMPRHVVLAQVGNTLARGIGHNFDHTGITFAAIGEVEMLLSEGTHSTYKNVVDCSNLQFSWTKSYREADHIYTYSLNPELTLNQRLSDITAANLSLSLLSESDVERSHLPWISFSPKQVYFLSLAQSFCSKKKVSEVFTSLYEGTSLLPFDRVFNLAANSEQFAEVFRCPRGSNMNSESKTRPFPLFEKEFYVDTL